MSELKYDPLKIISELAQLTDNIRAEILAPIDKNPRLIGKARAQLKTAISRIHALAETIDPIKQPPDFFDPSNPNRVGEIIAGALVMQPMHPIGSIPPFYGAGVYAIYYRGDFDAYLPIKNIEHPIYVGKADPQKNDAKTPEDQGTRLYRRLDEHRKTIAQAKSTLNIEDFYCRYLAVVTGWQTAAEAHLIGRYRPIWNKETKICYGFGKHGDDSKTRGNERSPWDMLHPGRQWAATNKENSRSVSDIKRDIAEHFKLFPPL
jgi:hypothetical protein